MRKIFGNTITMSAVNSLGVRRLFTLRKEESGVWSVQTPLPPGLTITESHSNPSSFQQELREKFNYSEFRFISATLPNGRPYEMYPLSGTEKLTYRQLMEFLQANPQYLDDEVQMHDSDEGVWFPLQDLRHESEENPVLVMQGSSKKDVVPPEQDYEEEIFVLPQIQ